MNANLFADPAPSASGALYIAHCNGGSRGNPGPSGYGAVIEDPQGHAAAKLSEFLGFQTNNYAEYRGLLAVLAWASEHGVKCLRVISDSELMVKQMQGKYKVGSPVLRPLWEVARRIASQLDHFEMRHTLRGGNKEADRLANEAMDKGMGRSATPKVGKPSDFAAARQAAQAANGPAGRAPDASESASGKHTAPARPAKPTRQILEGYVKDGVVHLMGGTLPDGIFVKIIRE
jgi:probable phosphoglycerate mutase